MPMMLPLPRIIECTWPLRASRAANQARTSGCVINLELAPSLTLGADTTTPAPSSSKWTEVHNSSAASASSFLQSPSRSFHSSGSQTGCHWQQTFAVAVCSLRAASNPFGISDTPKWRTGCFNRAKHATITLWKNLNNFEKQPLFDYFKILVIWVTHIVI